MSQAVQFLILTRGMMDDLPLAVVDELAEAEAIAADFAERVAACDSLAVLDALPARRCLLGKLRVSNATHVDILELRHGRPNQRRLHLKLASDRMDNGRKYH